MIWVGIVVLAVITFIFVFDTFRMRQWDEDMDRRLRSFEEQHGLPEDEENS